MKSVAKIIIAISAIIMIAVVGVLIIGEIHINDEETEPIAYEENKTEPNEPVKTDEPAKKTDLEATAGLTVVPTMSDKLTEDSTWCGTFQLVWNDMKNEVVKQDVVFTPQEKMAENLNKEEFTEEMISDEYYYKVYGLKSLELKEEIEKGIKEKFNQTSDILNSFDWSEDGLNDPNDSDIDRYFFYVMLYREFEYPKKFDLLNKGTFGTKYNNIEYFGIDGSTDDSVRKQIDVLYYNSKDDFAVVVETKSGDEVIFCKNPEGATFNEIYENMNKKAEEFKGAKIFKDVDELKIPKMDFNEKREYEELQGKSFSTANHREARIQKAIQTIQFKIDEKGGRIKSEAAMDVTADSISIREENVPRYFYLDDTFAMFLREEGKDLPYFAARVNDITKFQK